VRLPFRHTGGKIYPLTFSKGIYGRKQPLEPAGPNCDDDNFELFRFFLQDSAIDTVLVTEGAKSALLTGERTGND
jgi:hypothetical protein